MARGAGAQLAAGLRLKSVKRGLIMWLGSAPLLPHKPGLTKPDGRTRLTGADAENRTGQHDSRSELIPDADYGSEGCGFESLRARAWLRQVGGRFRSSGRSRPLWFRDPDPTISPTIPHAERLDRSWVREHRSGWPTHAPPHCAVPCTTRNRPGLAMFRHPRQLLGRRAANELGTVGRRLTAHCSHERTGRHGLLAR